MPYCCYTVFGKSHAPTSKANGYWVLGIGFVVFIVVCWGYHLHLLHLLVLSSPALLNYPLLLVPVLDMTRSPSRPMASPTSSAAGQARDDNVEEGDDAVNDRGEDGADAVHDGH